MKNNHCSPFVQLVLIVALFSSWTTTAQGQVSQMSFFVTSSGPGNGADLGGLAGADGHCQSLAAAVGAGDREWRAYLSTQGQDAVDARDRIGPGPWFNVEGTLVAENVEHLHSDDNNLNEDTALNELGGPIDLHDILTGSQLDGTAFPGDEDTTCQNWTGSGAGSAQVGHHNRRGLDIDGTNPTSWNSAHLSAGCSRVGLENTGGKGYFYCFAADTPGTATAVQSATWGKIKDIVNALLGDY